MHPAAVEHVHGLATSRAVEAGDALEPAACPLEDVHVDGLYGERTGGWVGER